MVLNVCRTCKASICQLLRSTKKDSLSNFSLIRMVSTQSSNSNIELNVEPQSCLHDEAISITASGLTPGQKVTLAASVRDDKNDFLSHSQYVADSNGRVDFNNFPSLGGSFVGHFPMGHLTCLTTPNRGHKIMRFYKKDVEHPLKVRFCLLNDHLERDDALNPKKGQVIQEFSHTRHFMASGVERIDKTDGRIKASLFMPKGDGPFPGVVDMFGMGAGLFEFRAAQLASRGIAALALAYSDYEGLPNYGEPMDLSYFEDAVKELLSHDKVLKPYVGVMAVSYGVCFASAMALYIDSVKAAVLINGYSCICETSLAVQGKVLPSLEVVRPPEQVAPHVFRYKNRLERLDENKHVLLPLHKSNADFLLLACLDDQDMLSELGAQMAAEQMDQNGHSRYKMVRYADAGHLLEPPYSPFCKASYYPPVKENDLWGGEPKEHCEAQVDSWKEILNFFKEKLK